MKLSPLRLAVRLLACVVAWMAIATTVNAHEFKLDAVINAFVKIEPGDAQLVVRAPLYLFKSARFPIRNAEIDTDNAGPALERAIAAFEQSLTLTENGKPLTASGGMARLSLPSDRSFTSYEAAQAHVAQSSESDTRIYVDQGYVDARITYPIGSPHSEFAIRTTAAPELGDYLKLAVRYMPLGGDDRTMVVTSSSGTVALNPTWWRAAATFTGLGITHILTGYDHLLFLLCLVIPLRGWRKILSVVTVFTIAHSFTLLGTAFELAPSGDLVPAVRRDGDRRVDRLHGAREHHGRRARTAHPDHRAVRPHPWIRLLLRPAGELPVRRDPSARFALRLQHRNRARPDPGPGLHAARARSRPSLRAARARSA